MLFILVRFIITLGHLLAISLVKGSLNVNIRNSLDPQLTVQNGYVAGGGFALCTESDEIIADVNAL
jgi:hypothetical protein